MTPRRLVVAAVAVAVAVVLAIGLVQLSGSGGSARSAPLKLTTAQLTARLAGSPAPLAALHAQAGALLPGGARALTARLAGLRGRPVVINKWASWCEPCREEAASFQRASLAFGRTVAFIGIDSLETSRGDALAFLHSFPVSYPSYYDPSDATGVAITGSTFVPVTTFYDPRGASYTRQGPYLSQAKLEQDIRRYALDG
jgi:thiol-disulfide isomerase/thioredoxin